MKAPILCVFVAATLLPASQATAQTVVLVRHGEKASTPADDPGLTAAGEARATALAATLQDAGVDLILTSSLRRTIETAAPLSHATGIRSDAVNLGPSLDGHVRDIVARTRAAPRDATVVIIGHSNTLPAIAKALGVVQPVSLRECDYDNLFVAQLDQSRSNVITARYGEPSNSCSE